MGGSLARITSVWTMFFCLVKSLATWGCTCASSSKSYWFMFNIRVTPSIAGTYRVISAQCGPAVLVCLYQHLGCLWWLVFQHVSEVLFTFSSLCLCGPSVCVCESCFSHFHCLWTYWEGNYTVCAFGHVFPVASLCFCVVFYEFCATQIMLFYHIKQNNKKCSSWIIWYFGDQNRIDFWLH